MMRAAADHGLACVGPEAADSAGLQREIVMKIAGIIVLLLGVSGALMGNGYSAIWIVVGLGLLYKSGYFDNLQSPATASQPSSPNAASERAASSPPETPGGLEHLL
jgi:hypothetical protein